MPLSNKDQKNQDDNFLVCSACSGSGREGNVICPQCHGQSMGMHLEDFFLSWNRPLGRLIIWQNNIARKVGFLINSFLLIFGVIGLWAIGWQAWLSFGTTYFSYQAFIEFITKNNSPLVLTFLVSLLSDLYLYYRLNHESEKFASVVGRKYHAEENLSADPVINEWNDLKTLNRKLKIDVSAAYDSRTVIIIEEAYLYARQLNSKFFEPIHLLLFLISSIQVSEILARLEINRPAFKEKVSSMIAKNGDGNAEISLVLKKVFLSAYKIAYLQRKQKVDASDLLVAICQSDTLVSELFYDFGVDFNKIKNAAMWIGYRQIMQANYRKLRSASRFKPSGDIDRAMTALATPFLNQFGYNLTTMAKWGYLPLCVGRDDELDEIFRIIETGSTRNIMLVGEPGVGKTTVIEGIAQRMATEEVPEVFKDKRLVNINIATLIGGTTPDQAQARMIRLLDEVIEARNIVLVIEDIKALAGITIGGEQSLDLLGILAKALSGNQFICFATATPDDYTRALELNNDLQSVFHQVEISEVDHDGAIRILEVKAGPIEYKNQVYFSYGSLEKAVELSDRFIHDKHLPAKAIGIMEEAAVYVRKKRGKKQIITAEDAAEIISQITKIPATEVTEAESEKLLNLEEQIHRRIIGQDDAVKMVAASLRRARVELRNKKRPIANLLFLGPTGVGKTELAKTIAECYFNDENNMVRLDMSEYQNSSSINKLIGDRGEGGYLTEAIRKNPFSLVLLDEIEKADLNILNIFLQVMDDGRLTDGAGRLADFTNSIIIATSNAGSDLIQLLIREGKDMEVIKKELIEHQLKAYFKPEFLNRFDGIIVFNPLTMEEVKSIARLMVGKLVADLEQKGIILEVTDEAIAELATAGYDPAMGARPLRRVIQDQLNDTLATFLLGDKLNRRDTVVFEGIGKVTVKKAPQL